MRGRTIDLPGRLRLSASHDGDGGGRRWIHPFTGWTGACTGGATTTIYVNTIKLCTATFEPVAPATPRTVLVIDSQTGDTAGMGKHRVYTTGKRLLYDHAETSGMGSTVTMSAPDEGWSNPLLAPLNAPLSVAHLTSL